MSELRTIVRHAGTLLVGQMATMAFGVTDTIVAGRYSEGALAALSVGSAVYITVFVAINGMLQVLLPTWAELHGASKPLEVGRSVRQALYLAAFVTVAGVIALFFPGPLLYWTEVPEGLREEVRNYLRVLALALPPALLFRLYGTLNQSLGLPHLVTMLQAGSLLAKIPLTVWFVFGGLGVPSMGVAGCAWATVVVNYLFVGIAFWLLRTQSLYEPYQLWHKLEAPDWRAIWDMARLGLPAGLAIMVEVTSFTLMALFIARQGTLAAAGHQVASNLAAVLYMTPLSIAIATSARVSYWLGAGDPRKARHTIRTGFKLGLGMALTLSLAVWLGREAIAAIYSKQPDVIAVASGLLAWLAVYHLGDAAQALNVFMLRCYRVVVAPLVAYCVLLWGLGLGGGFVLAYRGLGPWGPMQSPAAFWMASSFALAVLAFTLPVILWRAVRAYRPA